MEAGQLPSLACGVSKQVQGKQHHRRPRPRSESRDGKIPGLKRPVSYVCYLCGCQFGSQSLFIHIGKCQDKWYKKELLKPPRERIPLPPAPEELESCELPTSGADIEDFNNKMFSYWNTVALCKCTTCGRTFNEEAFSKHVEKCGGGIKASQVGPAAKPLAYVCYICGQQFGSKSLRIHISNCSSKWEQRESVKPGCERRPVPAPPSGFDPEAPLPSSPSGIEEFNRRMFQAYNEGSLCRCQHCGRAFNEEALARHSKMCTVGLQTKGGMGGGFGGSPSRMAQGASSSTPHQKPRAYTCYLCGQQYGSQSLKMHVPKCQKKFQEEQKQKAVPRLLPAAPAELDDPLPSSAADVDAFNAKMFQVYNNCSLATCNGCGRSFHSEAYEKHVLRCPGSSAAAGTASTLQGLPAAGPRKGTAAGPPSTLRTYCCYLCGQQFGSSSLKIHLKTCQDKWDRAEAQRPPSQRRNRPAAPEELLGPLPQTATDMEQFNSKMTNLYNTASLIGCAHCGRTFSDTAWKNHRKICTAERPMKGAQKADDKTAQHTRGAAQSTAVGSQGLPTATATSSSAKYSLPEDAGQDASQQNLGKCETCGRSFNMSALERHMRVCQKVFVNKRKPMDLKKQRLKGVIP